MSQKRAGLKTLSERSSSLATIAAAGVLVLLVALVPSASANAASTTSAPSKTIGTLLASLSDPAATSGDTFGWRVAIAGTTAVVGAPEGSPNAGDGAAYIYEEGASGWPTTPTTTLHDPLAAANDQFGSSVAVAVTGTTVVVGAPGSNSNAGAAYIYVRGSSGWSTTPTVTLKDPAVSANDEFGYSVAVSRSTAMTIVVGAPASNSGDGTTYVYVNSGSGWSATPTTALADPAANTNDRFGYSVAVSAETVVVGAPAPSSGDGTTYIYVSSGSGWPATPSNTLADPAATAHDRFGDSVAVSAGTVAVGAAGSSSRAGAAYIYVRGTTGWSTAPTATLTDPAAPRKDDFGYSVALQGRNKRAVVGAPGSSGGAAYIYVMRASGWSTTPTATLTDPLASRGDDFGGSVAVFHNTAVVGAFCSDVCAGAAYIYKA